jgi:hypothetical protein
MNIFFEGLNYETNVLCGIWTGGTIKGFRDKDLKNIDLWLKEQISRLKEQGLVKWKNSDLLTERTVLQDLTNNY